MHLQAGVYGEWVEKNAQRDHKFRVSFGEK